MAVMFRAKHTPPLSILLDDLFTRDPGKIAQHLGVTPRTLARWVAADDAPRPVLLALFYETRWGYSLLETTAHNGALHARQHAASLERENASLRSRIARLERIGGFGAANEPLLVAGAAGAGVFLDKGAYSRHL